MYKSYMIIVSISWLVIIFALFIIFNQLLIHIIDYLQCWMS